MKTGMNNLTEEEINEVYDALDPFYFKKYCGSCCSFQSDECPFRDEVIYDTEWEKIGCNNFFD